MMLNPPTQSHAAIIALVLFSLSCSHAGEYFTIIVLPDTQFYSASMHGGTPEIFEAQTRWIVENRENLNIVFVTHVGDLVEHGDEAPDEWRAANAAMSLLDDSEATGLSEGIPYGIAVGNHDQSPASDADGSTSYFNHYFGFSRFMGKEYYGGHYGENNDNHYELFSASGLDFLVIHIEYDLSPDDDVHSWADSVLIEYPDRRAILVTHYLIGSGNPAEFSPQGQSIYDALKGNPNLFLMIGGHIGSNGGEGQRVDTYDGSTVISLLVDYQNRVNGGNGMLRILRFNPVQNEILARTFSPYANSGRGSFETDENSEFVLHYEMN